MPKALIFIITLSLVFSLIVGMLSYRSHPKDLSQATSSESTSDIPAETESYVALNYSTVKAIWISQFDMSTIYTSGGKQREKNDCTKKVKQIIKNIGEIGINTVYFQVRPNGDSIYPSLLYPTSK